MSDESTTADLDQTAGFAGPYREPQPQPTPLRRMLGAIPPRQEEAPRDAEAVADADHGIAAAAANAALKNSEARRDAVLAVLLAIKRRGGNPVTDWTTKDVDTAYAIAEQLMALGG